MHCVLLGGKNPNTKTTPNQYQKYSPILIWLKTLTETPVAKQSWLSKRIPWNRFNFLIDMTAVAREG